MTAYPAGEREVVHRVLAQRRDVRRGFRDEPVDDEVLGRILASAHRAPSVGLSQPWDFLLIRDRTTRTAVRALAAAQRDTFAASLPACRANGPRRSPPTRSPPTPMVVRPEGNGSGCWPPSTARHTRN